MRYLKNSYDRLVGTHGNPMGTFLYGPRSHTSTPLLCRGGSLGSGVLENPPHDIDRRIMPVKSAVAVTNLSGSLAISFSSWIRLHVRCRI